MIKGYDFNLLDLLEQLERELNEVPFYASSEKNTRGTCLTFALATISNYLNKNSEFEGKSYIPSNKYSEVWRNHYFTFYEQYGIRDAKEITLKKLLAKVETNEIYEVCVCCNGGYHSIAIINKKIYSNGQELTYNKYMNSMFIIRDPKVKALVKVEEKDKEYYKKLCIELKLER